MTTDPAAMPRPNRRAGRTPAALWADGIAHLEAFIAEHRHARVPKGYVCADGMRLASWVMHRREDRRLGANRLTPERIAQLDALGFNWSPPRPGRSVDDFAAQSAAILERLTRYRDEHGNLDVPHRWVCEDGFRLGAWVSRRRTERRSQTPTLTLERIRQLDAIGFDWGTTTNRGTFEQQRWANAILRLRRRARARPTHPPLHLHRRIPPGAMGHHPPRRPPPQPAIAHPGPHHRTRQSRLRLGHHPNETLTVRAPSTRPRRAAASTPTTRRA
ncbi:hypothetical protein ABIC73_004469 [Prescottella equi]|uniref:helicase associated domain-containing protein n=1 Tax=Rhodococcus hoagii TaxID=43767 RepID=UPI0019F8FAB3|nr:hypothetical protein [Prescottella equi]